MPLVNIMVNGRAYTVACDEGEEDHLKELGERVDSKVRELLESVGQVGDQRLLLMAALLLADEHHAIETQLAALKHDNIAAAAARDELDRRLHKSEGFAADTLEAAAQRIENIAARLSHA
ncbi:MAG: cell division protein ZapA [Alphaproteobacteria bacterium]|jgi:cell division protein ZapA|nr:cell division protein ZapA [Alphaproteobacteria bacterium]MDE1985893.1 cell division protein ZapA [Alphaproteobacteria bacterium]MDE2163227.1 cell division protein ZapA [Alphaproteobacteria bacterium]MDE2266006.1 cell division protein ZapA [Alphaproteobacteria bacterium]MDE2499900.1 cell division protein ZapA [Alphaproteobacteria bacterium]